MKALKLYLCFMNFILSLQNFFQCKYLLLPAATTVITIELNKWAKAKKWKKSIIISIVLLPQPNNKNITKNERKYSLTWNCNVVGQDIFFVPHLNQSSSAQQYQQIYRQQKKESSKGVEIKVTNEQLNDHLLLLLVTNTI